jgi:hypothetical protein
MGLTVSEALEAKGRIHDATHEAMQCWTIDCSLADFIHDRWVSTQPT